MVRRPLTPEQASEITRLARKYGAFKLVHGLAVAREPIEEVRAAEQTADAALEALSRHVYGLADFCCLPDAPELGDHAGAREIRARVERMEAGNA